MNTPPPETQNLPYWMIIVAFVLSLLLTLLRIVEGIVKALQKSNLEIVLTREVFFRILESESLYANVVLVANDGALVKDIKASLKKENGATKDFSLKIAQIGEKYRTSEGLYQFSFHSYSPLTFIPANSPQRQVYICEHESYAEATRQEFQKFQQFLFQLKDKYSGVEIDGTAVDQIRVETNAAINTACNKIQIEPGKYTLTIKVIYKQKGKYIPRSLTKEAESKLQFVVQDYARDTMRYYLNEYLQRRVYNFLSGSTDTLNAPTYSPSDVKEL
jgi:hypothetical protein